MFKSIQIELAEWFSISFLIGLSIAIVISSWLGENFGYKKVFIFSVAGFAVFSFGCSIAGSFEMFVISRFFCGIIIPSGNAFNFCYFWHFKYNLKYFYQNSFLTTNLIFLDWINGLVLMFRR